MQKPTPTHDKAFLARKNASILIAFIYLQDIFWISLSRLTFDPSNSLYRISELEPGNIAKFTAISVSLAFFSLLISKLKIPTLPEIHANQKTIAIIIFISAAANITAAVTLEQNARYTSGSLTGSNGIIYVFCQTLTLVSMVILLKQRLLNIETPKLWVLVLAASILLRLDGLASALTFAFFLCLAYRVEIKFSPKLFFAVTTGAGLFWMGLNSKLSEIPEYFTPDFMLKWTIGRFSIQAEQMYTFISDESIIGNYVSYSEIITRAISNRFSLIFGEITYFEFPKSLSEALLFDMLGTYSGGSSPGLLLNTTLQGPFFFIPPLAMIFIFTQFFKSTQTKLTLLSLTAYSFIFKGLHANFSEYLTIISPTIFQAAFFIIACCLVLKESPSTIIEKQLPKPKITK